MGSDPALILHIRGDQPMATTVIGRNWVGGVLIRLKLHILHMFGRKSWDGCRLRQDLVPLDSSYDPINDKMTSTLCEVQHH